VALPTWGSTDGAAGNATQAPPRVPYPPAATTTFACRPSGLLEFHQQGGVFKMNGMSILSRPLAITVALLSAVIVSGCMSAIRPVPVVPFIDGQQYMLAEPLTFESIEPPAKVVVPAGFVMDFASVPPAFHSVFSPTSGRCFWAAAVHDYLYWEQTTSREEADRIFLAAMEGSGAKRAVRNAVFRAVRVGGEQAWKQNAYERLQGLPRIVPSEHRRIPPNTTWQEYRQALYRAGVRP
jgi:hypothetical protein